mgnify:CR=1 FL=1
MKAKTRRAVQTRWMYRMESTMLKANVYANCDMPMAYLRRLAGRVWNSEAPQGRKVPNIKAGRGEFYYDRLASSCAGYTEIVLARDHRTVLVLLHELTHALGPCVHGAKFVKLYFYLLGKYGRFHRDLLQGVAAGRGIVLT